MKILKRFLLVLITLIVLAVLAALIGMHVMKRQAQQRQHEDRVLNSPKSGTHVAAADARIFVQRLGKPDAPPMVFIHGTGSWSGTWRASMEHATALGYQAIALDLPPFGYSVPPASGDYSKPRQARRILAALDSLGITRATFVAHSFGAAPVMEALMQQPQRASALILVDGALGLDSPQTDGNDNRLQSLLRQRWLAEGISAAFLTNPDCTSSLLRSFISRKETATADWITLYQKPLALNGSYQHIAQWLPELVSSRGQAKSDQIANYAALPFPVTLIWGETDDITPLAQARHLQGFIPGSRLLTIPHAGHIPQIEAPAQFLEALSSAVGKPAS